MRYHGGKWALAPWIISHFPAHRVYVEPFGGAASVLLRKPPAAVEVYNDLDEDVVAVFKILRDPDLAEKLRRAIHLTPWSRVEFFEAFEDTDDLLERARRTIIRTFMSHSSNSRIAHRVGFRSKNGRRYNNAVMDWETWPAAVPAFVERLKAVVVECRPAKEVILQHDSEETLFYIDPPYPISTRSSIRWPCEADGGRGYRFNMTDDEHVELSDVLRNIKGKVVASSYECDLNNDIYSGWAKATKRTMTGGGAYRDEVLYISPNAGSRSLFGMIPL